MCWGDLGRSSATLLPACARTRPDGPPYCMAWHGMPMLRVVRLWLAACGVHVRATFQIRVAAGWAAGLTSLAIADALGLPPSAVSPAVGANDSVTVTDPVTRSFLVSASAGLPSSALVTELLGLFTSTGAELLSVSRVPSTGPGVERGGDWDGWGPGWEEE